MDAAAISSAVSTVGFPIVAFIMMYRMARETIRENTEALQELKVHIKSQDGGSQ